MLSCLWEGFDSSSHEERERESERRECGREEKNCVWIGTIGLNDTHSNSYLSRSVSRDESRNPFANGLLSIFNFVICSEDKRK